MFHMVDVAADIYAGNEETHLRDSTRADSLQQDIRFLSPSHACF